MQQQQQRNQTQTNTNLLLMGAAGLIISFLVIYSFDANALFEDLSFKLAKNSPLTRPLTFTDSVAGILLGMILSTFVPLRFVLPAAIAVVIGTVIAIAQVKLPFKFVAGDFALAFATAATYAAGVRFRVETAHNIAIEAMVRGTLPQPVVEQIVKFPANFNLNDREVSTSVLAIHIVGFSTISEKFPADQFFPNMRAIYKAMAHNVHMFGGVLDRSFRDGFLAYFGDNMLHGSATQNHADMALQCAVQIQKANIGIILEADKFNKPVFALKCGIHSGRGYVGNLGDKALVNMSLVGRVVDTAAACATACEAHSIMFTKTTHDLLVKIDRGSPLFISRYMHMRNEEDMVKVIEFDPLHDSQDFRRQVMQALRKCAELERKGKRFYVKRTDYYQLRVNNGPAQLVNVSNGGIGVKLEKGFALGTEVQVLIQTTDEVLNRRLQYRNLNKVSGEVRWSKQQGSMYITGIQLKSLKADNTEFLLQAILDADRASA